MSRQIGPCPSQIGVVPTLIEFVGSFIAATFGLGT